MVTFIPFAPMILGVAGAAAAMILSAWGKRDMAIGGAILGLLMGAAVAAGMSVNAPLEGIVGSGGIYSLPSAVCLLLGAVALTASLGTMRRANSDPRTAALAALAASAAALASVALDLMVLFLAIEGLALCGYGLVALSPTDRARESAMKWFVQGSVATAFFIVGIGVLLSATGGSLSYGAGALKAASPGGSTAMAIGLVLIVAALAFKSGAFPFHSWMPDAYETARPVAAAVLASAGKVAPLAAALWLTRSIAGSSGVRVLPVFALISVASIVFGNLAALRQRSFARMLAYSGIAQVGYAFAGLAISTGAAPVLAFAVLYGLTSAASFVFIEALREAEPGWDGSIPGLAGLSRRQPLLAVSLVAIMLSLTGIPLTAGFWGKYLVFGAAASGGYVWLALAGVVGSVVSFGYYGGVLRSAFIDERTEEPVPGACSTNERPPIPGLATGATVMLAATIVIVGVLPLVVGLEGFANLR